MQRNRWRWRARAQGRAADTGSGCSASCIGLVKEALRGLMYAYGICLAEALRLFQLAAAQGQPHALFDVADCHEKGRGVPKNKAEAIRWYRRAQAAGNPDAAAALQRLRA